MDKNKMNIYLFDVDGTLTNPMKSMEASHAFTFLDWAREKTIFIVAGSDMEKVEKQLPSSVINRVSGIFCCMGNELWLKDDRARRMVVEYQNEFTPPAHLMEILIAEQMYGGFSVKPKIGGRGQIFEHRTGMLNFAPIGRNASHEERERYYEWDLKHNQRARIAKEIEDKFPELEAKIGGQISIDIQPKGANKSQASKWIRKNYDNPKMIFFGDKCVEGGNDFDLCLDIMNNKDGEYNYVDNPDETFKLLSKYEK